MSLKYGRFIFPRIIKRVSMFSSSAKSTVLRMKSKRKFSNDTDTDESKRFAFGSGDAPVVFTDGACANNGKTSAKAGYGVFWGDNHCDNISAPVSGSPTNNRAEYEAVYTALKQAKDKGLPAVTICTDSKLLVSSMDNWVSKWKQNNWRKSDGGQVRNRDLLEAIDGLRSEVDVKFHHVNRNSGVYGNEMADQLARYGALKYLARRSLS